jgi:hypothetical protein
MARPGESPGTHERTEDHMDDQFRRIAEAIAGIPNLSRPFLDGFAVAANLHYCPRVPANDGPVVLCGCKGGCEKKPCSRASCS